MPSPFPEIGKARGIDDLKRRLSIPKPGQLSDQSLGRDRCVSSTADKVLRIN